MNQALELFYLAGTRLAHTPQLSNKKNTEKDVFQGGSLSDKPSVRVDANLVSAILDHLASHPHAADSAAGVARWWLGPQGAAVALPDVELALKQLVDRQQLRQEPLADGTTLYSKDWKHSQKH